MSSSHRQPAPSEQLYTVAAQHYQAGRLDAAERGFLAVLAARPRHREAIKGLCLALLRQGKAEEAGSWLNKAAKAWPNDDEVHFLRGLALAGSGCHGDAVKSYQRSLSLKNRPETRINLGNSLARLGRGADAEGQYRRVIADDPISVDGHVNLAHLLRDQDRPAEALEHYESVLDRSPRDVGAAIGKGLALTACKRFAEAADVLERVVGIAPGHADAHNALGLCLAESGRPDDAEPCFRRALAVRPAFAEAKLNLGKILSAQGRVAEAVEQLDGAVRLRPNDVGGWISLGQALSRISAGLPNAIAAFKQALTLAPDDSKARLHLAGALERAGDHAEAVAALQPLGDAPQAWALLEAGRRNICDWSHLDEDERRVIGRVGDDHDGEIDPWNLLYLSATPAQQLACGRNRSARSARPPTEQFVHDCPDPGAERQIRIGYLSSDFRHHATSFLLAELIERHDRQAFHVTGYSTGPDDGSPMRRRMAAAFDAFVDLQRVGHRQAAERIHADRVDILVDLHGHTDGGRQEVLAYRPAPLQATYLGYPGTTGADFIDYAIVDRIVAPPEEQRFFSERLVHLPHSYQCNDRQRQISARTPSRRECGLPEAGFVFCCFNGPAKIRPPVFDVWMDLLRRVPGSVLWLIDRNPVASDNLRRMAIAGGVEPERLVFAPPLALPDHLARHRVADLFLDTLPVGAHTGASDALWAGLPLVTCRGGTFAGRVGASLLFAVGLPDLVTESVAGYRELAAALAADRTRLGEIRDRLARNRLSAPLFDIAGFTRGLEAAYLQMWEASRRGLPPTPFAVT